MEAELSTDDVVLSSRWEHIEEARTVEIELIRSHLPRLEIGEVAEPEKPAAGLAVKVASVHRTRHCRRSSVGSDHERSVDLVGGAITRSAHAGNPTILDDRRGRYTLDHLGSAASRVLHEDRIEIDASHAEAMVDVVDRRRCADDLEVSVIANDLPDTGSAERLDGSEGAGASEN